MGWSGGKPPAPDPTAGIAAQRQMDLAQEQFDWSKEVYERDVVPAMQRDMDLRETIQNAQMESMRKQDDIADYQLTRYRDTFVPIEDELVAEAKKGIDVQGRVNRALADYNQEDSNRERQMYREMGRMGMGSDTAMAYAAQANKNASVLGRVGTAQSIRNAAEGEDFARKASIAGMGRGLVMDTSNFMTGAANAAAAAGNTSAQGMGVLNQGAGFMRQGFGTSGNLYSGAGNLSLGITNANMQAYEAKQKSNAALMSAVGSVAGFMVGGPAGAAVGGSLGGAIGGGRANGGLIRKYADGGEVDDDQLLDPHDLATNQVNSALGLKAGGAVNRPPKVRPGATTRKGGEVSGPGGPKDDRVPALLSDGEFVMPVGAVQLFGVDRMEKMRQKGLAYEKQLGIGR